MIEKHFPFFIAAVEEQSFHRAAERLHIAQSAFSRRIADLERALGVALFERQARGVRPTAAGRALAADVRRILADIDQSAARARRVAEGGLGLLRLSFTEGIAWRPLLPAAVRRFRNAYPDVEIRFTAMTSEQQREALRRGELDVGFVFEEGGDREDFDLVMVAMNGLSLVLPQGHPLVDRTVIRFADLTQEAFIWPSPRTSPRLFNRMIVLCEERGVRPHIAAEVTAVEVSYSLVAAGMGVAVVVSASQPGREPPGVVIRQIEDFDLPMPLSMIWRRDDPPVVLSNFVRAVREVQAEEAVTT